MNNTTRNDESLAEPSLRDSELRYRRLFEGAQDGVLKAADNALYRAKRQDKAT